MIISSCRKFTEPGNPPSQLTTAAVFSSDATATAAQLAIYAQMEGNGFFYNLSVLTGLSADEMINYMVSQNREDQFNNNLTAETSTIHSLWAELYGFNYKANAVYEGVEKSGKISEAVKKQLQGEALFIRAFCHFYLARLFGDIPVITTTDYQLNAMESRKPMQEVYNQIEKDLEQAISLLSAEYKNTAHKSTSERTRPNLYAAKALLARVYLFDEKWSMAEATASDVINYSTQYELLPDLNAVFLKNSREAIWQIQSVVPAFNSYAGAMFPFSSLPNNVSLAPGFVSSFDTTDLRLKNWIKMISISGNEYFYPYKYKAWQNQASITEYTMALRIAELYLIRAEARGRQQLFTLANEDLNKIRSRAGLEDIDLTTEAELLAEIEQQRRFELFAESGDRWIDLRRTGRISDILSIIKAPHWELTDQLYPIPQVEIDRNKNLEQNPGY